MEMPQHAECVLSCPGPRSQRHYRSQLIDLMGRYGPGRRTSRHAATTAAFPCEMPAVLFNLGKAGGLLPHPGPPHPTA